MTCRDCLYCICRNCKHYCLADFRGEWNCYIDPDDEACEFFKGKEVEIPVDKISTTAPLV